MSNKKLDRALRRSNKKKEDKVIMLSGQLGIPLSGQKLVEVPNRQGFVFVRLKNNTSELIQAYNTAVSPIYDLPVLVARQTNGYRVIGRNIDRYTNQWGQAPYLPKHGAQHSFNPVLNIGGDIVWVYSQQFMPLLGYPSGSAGSPRLAISPYIIQDLSGNWKYVGNTGTPDVTPYSPTTGSRSVIGLLYIDTVSGNPGFLINSGTYIDSSLTGSNNIVPYIPRPSASQLPISAIRLVSGTSILTWDNVYDVRPFLQVLPTGSSGGGAMGFQDEGIPLGTATTLNVVGVNADISISGTVARLFITGSTGGGAANPPITGSFVLQDDGQTLGSALIFNAGPRLSASISGTTALLSADTVLLKTDDLTASVNGTGTTFQLTFLPEAGTLRLFYNGVRQRFNFNYTVSGTYVETLFVPSTGSVLIADYNESSSTGTINNVIGVRDEGILQGNASTFNFVGQGVTASVSGTTAEINISSGGRVLISSVSPAGTGTVTYNPVPSTYTHLEFVIVGRGTVAANAMTIRCEFNGDTTATNYRSEKFQGFGSTSSASGADDASAIDVAGGTAPTNSSGRGIISIPFYNDTILNKQIVSRWSYRNDNSANQSVAGSYATEWENTAAITRIDLKTNSGNFATGTIINFYGIS